MSDAVAERASPWPFPTVRFGLPLLGLTVSSVLFVLVAVQLETGFGGTGVGNFFANYLYDGVGLAAAFACFARGLRDGERLAWWLIGLGVLAWTLGDIYWTVALETVANPPFPSLADAGYLGLYLPAFVGLGLLVRKRIVHFTASVWLDGLGAGLTVCALAAGVVLNEVWRTSTGDFAAIATNMAYPAGDAVLLGLVLAAFGFSGWRFDRTWLLLGGGLGLFAVADSIYLVQVATNTYHYGTFALGWPAGFVLIAGAACAPQRRLGRSLLEGRALLVAPLTTAAVCLAIEIWDHFYRVNPVALIAASLGLAAVIARMALTFNEHLAMLRTSRIESLTDQLTGLGNRRSLMQRLESLFDGGPPPARLLLLFDLDGFKAYNDAFGHTAGDALLNRLGERLSRSIAGRGTAYRLGGDEFCVLVDGGFVDLEWVRAAAVASLRETGEAFAITCSRGHVVIPQEARTAESALQLADRRMYAEKGARLGDFRSRGALLQALAERDNELGRHTAGVAEYASRLAAEAGLRGADAKALRAAAELHDIGKLALPEALLAKPGPLDDQEWELVREHTLIGERIIAADDGLGPVASIVRSSHERWDGAGYPDGLAGERIPFAARIIAICDAYEAMTTTRAYRDALTHEEAVKELRDSAGSQFDPALVEMFIATIPATTVVPFARPA